ncbi:MAG TPA: hypothetical protein VKT30_16490 [Caulobacteraceae bacterium]|nr:hypothetical protein [Caulobacteraceae bacterium]
MAVALASVAVASAGGANAGTSARLAFARPPARPFHAGFHRNDGFREARQVRRAQMLFGGWGGAYGGYPAEAAAYQPEASDQPPPPVAVAYAPRQPYGGEKVCPVVWTWSAHAHEATKRSYCD